MSRLQRQRVLPAVLGLVVLALAACGGGGDATAPNLPYPAVAGVYQLDGGFDGATRAQASFTGSLTLVQATRTQGTLTGTLSITAQIGGQVISATDQPFTSASVTPGGAITFAFAGSGASWTFTGTLSGKIVTGRHTLTDGTTTVSGDWTGVRP